MTKSTFMEHSLKYNISSNRFWIIYLVLLRCSCAELSLQSYTYRYFSSIIMTNEIGTSPNLNWDPLPDEGAYGRHSPDIDITGQLLEPTPRHGCTFSSDSDSGQVNATYDKNSLNVPVWIALVERGACTFQIIIDHARNSGAKGVIVYTSQMPLVPMVYDDSGVDEADRLVTVLMTQDDYVIMEPTLSLGNALYVKIVRGRPVINNSFERIVIATISVSFLILLALSVGWVIIYYFQRLRLVHRRHKAKRQRLDLAEKALKKLRKKKLKISDNCIINKESCSVCIDDFAVGTIVIELPCKHMYHIKCIEPWLLRKSTCPMCKINVFEKLGLTSSSNNGNSVENSSPVIVEGNEMNANGSPTIEIVTGSNNIAFDPDGEQVRVTYRDVSPSMVMTELSSENLNNNRESSDSRNLECRSNLTTQNKHSTNKIHDPNTSIPILNSGNIAENDAQSSNHSIKSNSTVVRSRFSSPTLDENNTVVINL